MSRIYRVPGALLTEREHSVPLDHGRPDGPRITIFTREVTAPDGAGRPYLLFLQDGPGFEAPRPTRTAREQRIAGKKQRGVVKRLRVRPGDWS